MPNERNPNLSDLLQETRQAPHHALDIAPRWERDPLTPALLHEASIPPWLHRTLLSLRPPPTGQPSCSPTLASSSASPAPTATGAPRIAPLPATDRSTSRRRRAIANARLGAPGQLPISPEAQIELIIIMTVICDRRAVGLWEGWHLEAQDYIEQVIPTRRQLLQEYADMRALIRRRRLTWKLAEHITDLDDTLDSFPPVRRKP